MFSAAAMALPPAPGSSQGEMRPRPTSTSRNINNVPAAISDDVVAYDETDGIVCAVDGTPGPSSHVSFPLPARR